MKHAVLYFLALLLLASCKNADSERTSETSVTLPATGNFNFGRLEGEYSGDFGGTGDIRIMLRHVTGVHAIGYNLHQGLRRNISGRMEASGNGFSFTLEEPGDNPYDGIFHFSIDTVTFALKGDWTPLNNKTLSPKSFALQQITTVKKDTAKDDNAEWMQTMYDSTGEFHFEPGGLCIYRYYTDQNDTTAMRQYEEVKGNWRKTDTEYIIDWQKNRIFPKPQSRFKIQPFTEMEIDGAFYLEGEGRRIEPQLAG